MLTVLTPTYNRGYILQNAYESLCRQTSTDFEWVVVDDGSSDNTGELVRQWQASTTAFPIVYDKQENGGKHRAVNRGVALAKGEYVLVLDSDDHLTDDAVEVISKWTQQIAQMEGFAGVAGLRGWVQKADAIGGFISREYIDATNLQRRKFGLLGDKAEVYKTEILRQYPFPEFPGENFLRESAVWDAIALDGYKLRWYNRIIYKCEYLADGLTKTISEEKKAANFQGQVYCANLAMRTLHFPYKDLRIGMFCETAKYLKKTDKEICQLLGIGRLRLYTGKLIYQLRNLLRR